MRGKVEGKDAVASGRGEDKEEEATWAWGGNLFWVSPVTTQLLWKSGEDEDCIS